MKPISESEVWESGQDPDSFKAKYGQQRLKSVEEVLTSLPSGSYTSKSLQAALDGLKRSNKT